MVRLAENSSDIRRLFREIERFPEESFMHHIGHGGIDTKHLEKKMNNLLSPALSNGLKVLIGFNSFGEPDSFMLFCTYENSITSPDPFLSIVIWSNFSKTKSASKNSLKMFDEVLEISKSFGCKYINFYSGENYAKERIEKFFVKKGLKKTATQYTYESESI